MDASRKNFAGDKEEHNRKLLDGLQQLVIDVIKDLTSNRGKIDAANLPHLFGGVAGNPKDALAAEFREKLLEKLDAVQWVAVRNAGDDREYSSPKELLLDIRDPLPESLPTAFPPSYVKSRLECYLPVADEKNSGLTFLAERPGARRLDCETLETLLTPGDVQIWGNQPDEGFRSLLSILSYLREAENEEMERLLVAIRGNNRANIIPVVAANPDGLRFVPLPLPNPEDGLPNPEDGAILARYQGAENAELIDGGDLVPPPSLSMHFLPDGLLGRKARETARWLGIREYTTDAVLDRLAAFRNADPENIDQAQALLRFLWRLLLRASRSRFSVIKAVHDSRTFRPGHWYWCQPGDDQVDADRVDQRRARALSRVLLPSHEGEWRPADELVFNNSWVEWLETLPETEASRQRIHAYGDLQRLAARNEWAASPELFQELLPLPENLRNDDHTHAALLHGFLLRLGVWEVPPIEAMEPNYQERGEEQRDPWQGKQERTEQQHWVCERDGWYFGSPYQHDHVHVAEDYRLRWPLVVDGQEGHERATQWLNALSHGVDFYSRYQRAILFCPRCHQHYTRHYNDGIVEPSSFLAWELGEKSWVPVTIAGQPELPVRPREAWWVLDPPDGHNIIQSPLRFLPLVPPNTPPELISLLGIGKLESREQNKEQLFNLLTRLRELFDNGKLGADPQTDKMARQTFIGLHRRLYALLTQSADQDDVPARLGHIEVLSECGGRLLYGPPRQTRHDDGRFAIYKRHFVGQVSFVSIPRDKSDVARVMGVPPFELTLTPDIGNNQEDVTSRVVHLIRDRLAEFMALLVFHRLGGPNLELDSEQFRARARRLLTLRIIQVPELVLHAQLIRDGQDGVDPDVIVRIDSAPDDDNLYCEGPSTPQPVLYHDFQGEGWEHRFRTRLAPHVAAILESPAYAHTFALLLQFEESKQREGFLMELGITEEEMEQVHAVLGRIRIDTREEERRWWQALLLVLGIEVLPAEEAPNLRDLVRQWLTEHDFMEGQDNLGTHLLDAGGGRSVRFATGEDCALRILERILEGVNSDLRQFHQQLLNLGDSGLRITVAADRLRHWKAAHGREVAALLYLNGWHHDEAKAAPDAWRVPDRIQHRIADPNSEFLDPVLADLERAGVQPDRNQLAGIEATAHLAELAGMTLEEFGRYWRALYDPGELTRLRQERALAWHRALRPVIVALRTHPNDPSLRIRAAAEEIDRTLPINPERQSLIEALGMLLVNSPKAFDVLTRQLGGADELPVLNIERLNEEIGQVLDAVHLERVRKILSREPRQHVERIRRSIDMLTQEGLTPTAYQGVQGPPELPGMPRAEERRRVNARHVRRNQRHLDRLGREAEEWALAAVLRPLLALELNERRQAVDELIVALRGAYQGSLVDRLVDRARIAVAEDTDEEERVEALAGFLHLSRESDEFGCDLLSYLSPYPDVPERPLFLEIKSSQDRTFFASNNEWQEAERLADSYAFLVVVRGEEMPQAMEILPNPVALLVLDQIERNTDNWRISYLPNQELGGL